MPNYSKIRDMISHRIVIEYDTGARIVGYLSNCRPNEGEVMLVTLARAQIEDAQGTVLENHDSLTVCPNLVTGVALEEGPSARA